MNALTRALSCVAVAALLGCSSTPATPDTNPTDTNTSTADVEGAGGSDTTADEAKSLPTPPQPGVALDVLYEEENIEALNDWTFEFSEWEAFGPFKIYMHIDEVVAILGEPEEVTQQSEWYGSLIDYYAYPSKGYGFHVSRDEGDGYEGKILSISVRGPAADVSRLGVKIGSHAEEVEKVYGPYVNWRVSGEGNLSVGFMYTWVQFMLDDGFVTEMQMGTGDPFDSFGDGED